MKKIIEKDFNFENIKKDTIYLKFLKKYSKSKVFISKKSGLIFHDDYLSSAKVVNEWSDKIYNGKMNPKKNFYTDDFPGMSARHYFVLDFLSRQFNIKNKKIIDFAFGEGGLLLKARKIFNCKNLYGVEHSIRNIIKMKKRFKQYEIKTPTTFKSNIENFNPKIKFDIGIITWTLCNCSEPLKIIESISKNIKKNGYLIVAESSRIMVPFKKPIFNYFNPYKKSGHTHPWHWSFNSLCNIFKYYGFELVNKNRYFDENDLVLIFKNSKKQNQKYLFDDYKKVIKFLKRWAEESKYYKKFNS